jgi:hypothetical protein
LKHPNSANATNSALVDFTQPSHSQKRFLSVLLAAVVAPVATKAQGSSALRAEIDRRATEIPPRVIAWRRDIHQHPELSFQETRTAALVAQHLKSLGLEQQESKLRISAFQAADLRSDRISPAARE